MATQTPEKEKKKALVDVDGILGSFRFQVADFTIKVRPV